MRRTPRYRGIVAAATLLLAACGGAPKESGASLAPSTHYRVIDVRDGGMLRGTVRVAGDVAAARRAFGVRAVTNNQAVCCAGDSTKPQQQLRGEGDALRDVLVALVRCDSGTAPAAGGAELDQVACDFVPHVLALLAGDTLHLRNGDPIIHSVHGYRGSATVFNVATPMRGVRYAAPCRDTGEIVCVCDAGHTWMQARVHILPNPYFAVTDSLGRFAIAGIPPGAYTVRFTHELWPSMERPVSIAPRGTAQLDDTFDLARRTPAPGGRAAP